MLVPAEDILASSHIFTRQMLWYVMVVFLMSLPIIFLIGRALSCRIVSLKQKMHDFSHGQTVEYVPDPGNDEISDLTNSFYHMQNHIQELMQEQYLQGSEIKNLELPVLQSQINPHFLYNTLDMIYSMASTTIPPIWLGRSRLLENFTNSALDAEKRSSLWRMKSDMWKPT